MTRGDIVVVYNNPERVTGSEWLKNRPAVVVSNNACNKHSPVVEIIYLTTSPRKRHLPTHVPIHSSPDPSVALCEAIYSVDKSRIDRTLGHCSKCEMNLIDNALMISLGLKGF